MERISSITGYPLDNVQQQALCEIEQGYDVLTVLSTGSGKTTIALTAIILNAFDKGKRAILTTPIKALSNQKYAEFQKWLTTIGFPNRITLLTGDIQARCTPPGGDGLPELLIMTSEILANKLDREQTDPDLDNVGVLVMDEAHYINDHDRGHVWERTIMLLPTSIQIVALSATLSQPEQFQEWLSKRRPTKLVQRKERYVPLHFGFYKSEKGTNKWVELYNTSLPASMDSKRYQLLIDSPPKGTFAQSINKITKILDNEQRLPAIIFLMSKLKCEEAACCLSQNFLYGTTPVISRDQDPLEFSEIVSEHSHHVKTIRQRQDALFNHYLRPYQDILASLPGFETFKQLIDKGIAYHHAGMIPILREYVEILFSEKLLKVVFATETLAVGINMPAKCVVFTSLEKPSQDGETMLRPEQFMQMSGRAGRRGMDDKGYVVYYPIRHVATDGEFRQLLFGKMPAATSQLSISPLFVLKSQKETITKSLLYHQQASYVSTLVAQLKALPELTEDTREKMKTYLSIKEKLMPGLFKLTPSQKKSYERELANVGLDQAVVEASTTRMTLEREIVHKEKELECEWDESVRWLHHYGFLENDEKTIAGKIASGLSDGLPLVRAMLMASNEFQHVSFESFAGWLGCFTESLRVTEDVYVDDKQMNGMLEDTMRVDERLKQGGQGDIEYNTGLLVYMWAHHKDIHQICNYIGSGQLGTFVKVVLRVISYMDEIKKVLLGLQYYELYNCLDHHQDRLMNGLVTNRSLYVEQNVLH
jgi:superfamily II RNA helicase